MTWLYLYQVGFTACAQTRHWGQTRHCYLANSFSTRNSARAYLKLGQQKFSQEKVRQMICLEGHFETIALIHENTHKLVAAMLRSHRLCIASLWTNFPLRRMACALSAPRSCFGIWSWDWKFLLLLRWAGMIWVAPHRVCRGGLSRARHHAGIEQKQIYGNLLRQDLASELGYRSKLQKHVRCVWKLVADNFFGFRPKSRLWIERSGLAYRSQVAVEAFCHRFRAL